MNRFERKLVNRMQIRAKSNHNKHMQKQIASGCVVIRFLLNNKNGKITSRFKFHLNAAPLRLNNSK